MRTVFFALISALPLIILPLLAHADVVDAINGARAQGCGGRAGVNTKFTENSKLNAAARRMAQGASLREAMDGADYHGVKSTSVRMSGSPRDAAVGTVFRQKFCSYLVDSDLLEIGFHRQGRGMWFVLAQPFPLQALRNANSVNYRVFTLVNEARSRPRRCGRESFPAAPPLTLLDKLSKAALEHSKDMAKRNYFDHGGTDGSQPADRVSGQNYKWQAVGENIAAGMTTPEEAVKGWIASPHHCAVLMNARFTETGVGFAVRPGSTLGVYWTQVFAKPR